MRPEVDQVEGEVALYAPFPIPNELLLHVLVIWIDLMVRFMLLE